MHLVPIPLRMQTRVVKQKVRRGMILRIFRWKRQHVGRQRSGSQITRTTVVLLKQSLSFKDPSEHGHNDGKRWVRLKRREQDNSLRHLIELAAKSRPGEILSAVVDRTEKQGSVGS